MRHWRFAVLGIAVFAIGVFSIGIDDVTVLFGKPVCITILMSVLMSVLMSILVSILMSAIDSGLLYHRKNLLQQAGVQSPKTCSDLGKIVQQLGQSDCSKAAQHHLVLKSGYLPTRRSLYTNSQVVQQYGYLPRMLPVAEEPLQSRQCAMRLTKPAPC